MRALVAALLVTLIFLQASDFIPTLPIPNGLAFAFISRYSAAGKSLAASVHASRWARSEMQPRDLNPITPMNYSSCINSTCFGGGVKYFDNDSIGSGSPAFCDVVSAPDSHAAKCGAFGADCEPDQEEDHVNPIWSRFFTDHKDTLTHTVVEFVNILPDVTQTARPVLNAMTGTLIIFGVTVVGSCLISFQCGRARAKVAAAREEQDDEQRRAAVHGHGGRWLTIPARITDPCSH